MTFGTFYTHKPNPRSTAILAIAKAQGLKLDIVYCDRDDAENHAKLKEINPLAQVPVFVGADGYVLTECIPIALYLTSQSDTTTLLGSSRQEYHDILKWMSMANSDMMPAVGGVLLPLLGRHEVIRKNGDDCLRAFYADAKLLDRHLSKNSYLIGEKISLADFFVVAMLQFPFMVFHKELYPGYPKLTAWFNEVYNVPMFKDIAGDLHLLDVLYPKLSEDE